MSENDPIPSCSVKIIYYDNDNNEVHESCAFHKMTTYYDNAGNIIKWGKTTRFSLEQDW